MIAIYQFTQGMWSKDPSMTNVLFDTKIDRRTHDSQYNKPE